MKKPQQHFRIAQRARLLREISVHPPPKNRRSQSATASPGIAGTTTTRPREFPPAIACRRGARCARGQSRRASSRLRSRFPQSPSADLSRRRFVLRLPGERVVVTPIAEVQKATHRHLEIERRVERPPRRNRQQRFAVRPHLQLFHRGNQRQPVGDVVVAQTAGPILHVRFQVKDGIAKFMMTRARDLGQVLDQALAVASDQARNRFFAQP